ncbi:hypothetical protein AMECASPLE_037193 [Ameca splendens]|uniref:Uncharacterized protein n=1 Tax=Ameca splendens TaxID=208324 RepID=A0ABV0XWW2_9TELE
MTCSSSSFPSSSDLLLHLPYLPPVPAGLYDGLCRPLMIPTSCRVSCPTLHQQRSDLRGPTQSGKTFKRTVGWSSSPSILLLLRRMVLQKHLLQPLPISTEPDGAKRDFCHVLSPG